MTANSNGSKTKRFSEHNASTSNTSSQGCPQNVQTHTNMSQLKFKQTIISRSPKQKSTSPASIISVSSTQPKEPDTLTEVFDGVVIETRRPQRKLLNHYQIKYCSSGLKAVEQANIKGSQKYDASGVVAIQCRHMMIQGDGVGDLQKGER